MHKDVCVHTTFTHTQARTARTHAAHACMHACMHACVRGRRANVLANGRWGVGESAGAAAVGLGIDYS